MVISFFLLPPIISKDVLDFSFIRRTNDQTQKLGRSQNGPSIKNHMLWNAKTVTGAVTTQPREVFLGHHRALLAQA